MIDTELYQPARQPASLTRQQLHILARQADIFGINQFTFIYHIFIAIRNKIYESCTT
jgi:hypothetical protein